jgi:signal transduction histidine kinase/DNA-binding NarL/FixJ family response regulator/HPt (histidine-containing phosphotransfer) domain-containing protein
VNRFPVNSVESRKGSSATNPKQEKLHAFLEQAGVIFLRTDAIGNVTYLSSAFSKLVRRPGEEFLGQSFFLLFPGEEDEAASAIAKLRQGEELVRLSVPLNGGLIADYQKVEFTLSPSVNKWGEWIGMQGVILPALSQGHANRIESLKSKLGEAEKIKERFLAKINHEIRTPLNGILGMVQLLQKTGPSTEQQEFLDIIFRSGNNLLQTLNQLIDLSLDPVGKLKLQEDEIDLGKLFAFMSSLFSEQAMLKGIDLDFQIQNAVPLFLSDEFRIQQILKQLLSNSINYTEKGGVRVVARLEKIPSGPALILEVSDSGNGMDAEKQKHATSILLGENNQLPNFSQGGSGLGLQTIRIICDALNAEPGFVSSAGNGSTFWVKIPVQVLIPEKKSGLESSRTEMNGAIRKMSPRVLLVDDNAVNLKVASEILNRAGCRVIVATNGKEAVEKAGKEFFHLVFMDIQMPVMDGLQASRKIQELGLDNPPVIVAMTAYVQKEDKRRFLEAGIDDLIPKPISGDQLLSRVRHWTEKSLIQNPMAESSYRQFEKSAPNLEKVFDFEVLRNLKRHLGEDILCASMEEFAAEMRDLLDGVGKAMESSDAENLHRYFHTIKGNAGTFGLMRIAAVAADLEIELKNGDFAALDRKKRQLEESAKEFLDTYTLLYTDYEWKN